MTTPAHRLIRNSLIFAVASALPRLGSFLLLPVYARFMDPASVGVLGLMTSIAALLAILLRWGQEPALLRLHFDFKRNRGELYATALVITVGTGLAATVLCSVFIAEPFDGWFAGIGWVPFGVVALAIAVANSLQFVPIAWLRAEERPGRYAAFSTGVFLAISTITAILLFLGLDALGALIGQLAGALISAGYAVAIVLRMPGSIVPNSRAARALLGFGIPLLPHAVSVWVLSVSDRWLIGSLSPAEAQSQIGIYWVGYQLASGISLVASAVQAAWTPILFRKGDTKHGVALFGSVTTLAALGFVGLAAALGVYAPEIISLFATDAYRQSVEVMRISVFSAVGYGIYMMTVGAVMLTRRTKPMALITIVSAVLNVGLNFALIPELGIVGAAWSSVAGYGAYAVLTALYARRIYLGRMSEARVFLILAVAAGAVALAFFIEKLSFGPAEALVDVGLVGAVAIAVLLAGRSPYRRLSASEELGSHRQSA